MAYLFEVGLSNPREPLQIPYPKSYMGAKSGKPTDQEFHLSVEPRYLFQGEIEIAEKFVSKLPYPQRVVRTGAVLNPDGDDPLAQADHDELDRVEKAQSMPNTRKSPTGGERSPYERVLIIRERGYFGNNSQLLRGK